MVFFYFGKDSSSWAAGNDCYSFQYGLVGDLKTQWDQLGALFNDKSMAGTRIQWLSTCPDGSYCLQERNGMIYSNRTDLMQAIRNIVQSSPSSWNQYRIEHVSFSPYGAWLLRAEPSFGAGMVQLSSRGHFPDSFISMAAPYIDFRNHGLQASGIQYAFFGAQDGVLVKFANGGMRWDRLGTGLVQDLQSLDKGDILQRCSIGKNTTLCPYDCNRYFLHLVPVMQRFAADSYRYSVSCHGLTANFLNAVVQGTRPAPGSIPQPPSTAAPKPAPQPAGRPAIPQKPPTREKMQQKREEKNENKKARWGGADSSADGTASSTRKTNQTRPQHAADIPPAARDIFGKSFDETVSAVGRDYLTGLEASEFMREAGLSNEILAEIWERADVDGNGRFDREEFIHAMWLISTELARLQDDGVVPGETRTDPGVGSNPLNAASNFTALRRTDSMPLRQPTSSPPRQAPSSGTNTGSSNAGSQTQENPSEVDRVSKQFGDMKLRESLLASIVTEKPNVQWDDVAGLGPAKEELQEAIIFPLRFPQMFRGKRQARRAILLYGPPGTGKSYLAKAVATEVEHTLFSISSSDVMSKWFGDSEGLVRQLFDLAREKKPAIIFIDEIDALCSNRDGGAGGGPGGGNEHTARMKTELLVQMDGVGKDNTGVLLLAATNLPWSLDPAVRRRFQKRIHIPLPDYDARRELFRIHLGDLGRSCCADRDLDELARRSEGFSGSDVANAVQDALMVPIKKVQAATHFKKVRHDGEDYYTPCDKTDPRGVPMTWKKVPPSKLKEPELTAEDLFVVMNNVKPSVAGDEIAKYHQWTEQFGLEGA